LDYAQEVVDELRQLDIRVSLNNRSEKIGAKIRQSELEKVNVMLILGVNEKNEKSVSLRRRFDGDVGKLQLQKLKDILSLEIKNRRLSHS
jgi:threonyl-tRNA synthetase